MVHSTSPSPLVIIPHGDFEKQATQRLGDALTSGLIKQAIYLDLCKELQWALPFQQEQFIVHINDQIRSATPTLIPNPNVRPYSRLRLPRLSTSPTVESELHDTDNWWNDKINPSAPIPTSSPSAPHTFTPPTSVTAGIETPITTKISAHDRVYSNTVPCRDLPATSPPSFRPMQTT